ncbi:hypothetical protein HPG69_003521 [Diceros bicornis minor]|uniref:RING-type E3 ubiquitin transferase n=1 Tax=Diceros bicornis minor TaxID=77932 RepID=A0A7J7EH66_DICBM|nr:hypothetical protein HPG69_003521 [Diceros bicornis minor]
MGHQFGEFFRYKRENILQLCGIFCWYMLGGSIVELPMREKKKVRGRINSSRQSGQLRRQRPGQQKKLIRLEAMEGLDEKEVWGVLAINCRVLLNCEKAEELSCSGVCCGNWQKAFLFQYYQKLHQPELAKLWAVSNREMLIAQNSSLEFKLHRLYFISLLMGGTTNQREALQYAKNFQPFALNHQKDIQVLMGSLVYLRQGIENSPYVHLLDANQWADICDIFTRDACALLGLSVESPLSVSFSAGCVALPALINIKAVIEQRQCTGVWNQKDELPIEVDLGKKCWYHSIFACPILRQQTTDNNPPMKLVCGHIISRDALNKMFNGSKLKCPYCPMEQSPGDAKQIFF